MYRLSCGEKVAISIRRLPLQPMSLEKIGLPSYIKTMLEVNTGIILVIGPTRSGKIAQITSMLNHINAIRSAYSIMIKKAIKYALKRKQTMSAKDAMRATYNQLELHVMSNGIR